MADVYDSLYPDPEGFLSRIAASEEQARRRIAEIEHTYRSFNGDTSEILRYRQKLEHGAIRAAAKERKQMMNEALARDPTFQPSDGGAPVVTLFGGGVMRVGAPTPSRAPPPQPRHAPPPEEDFSHLDPDLRDAMRQFAQMERDEAMAMAASLNLPEEPSRVVRTAAVGGAPASVPTGRPSYSPLRVPGEGGGGGAAPPASTTQPTAKLNLKVPTGAGAATSKPSAPKPPVAPTAAPPAAEKKRSWFSFGSKK